MTNPTSTTAPVIGSLCTGYGGLDLGVADALGGARLAWFADSDPHASLILAARLPGVPNLGDIRAVDWTTVEPVDIVTAGFPCQDISSAGRRAGIEKGERSGVWQHIVEAIRVLHPKYTVVENVAALRWRNGGLHRVLGDLAEAGYDAIWRSVRASDVGAAHRRERVFILGLPATDAAYADRARRKLERTTRRQPAGRTHPARPATTASNTNGSRLTLCRDPDSPRSRSSHAAGMRDADRLRSAAADTDRLRRQELHPPDTERRAVPARSGTRRPGEVAADATGDRRHKGLPKAARLQGRPHAALGDHPAADAGTTDALLSNHAREVDWGIYADAIGRWQRILGRPTPFPTQPGRHGRPVLAPAFVEHLMGLPPGWVTDLPLPRTAQLRALGNGVVPQQAAAAISLLLADLDDLRFAGEPVPDAGEARAA